MSNPVLRVVYGIVILLHTIIKEWGVPGFIISFTPILEWLGVTLIVSWYFILYLALNLSRSLIQNANSTLEIII